MRKILLFVTVIACLAFAGCSESDDGGPTNLLVGSKWERTSSLGSMGIWNQNIEFISGNNFRYNSYIYSYGEKYDEWTVNIGYEYSKDNGDAAITGVWPFEDEPSPFVAVIIQNTMALKIEGESVEYYERIE